MFVKLARVEMTRKALSLLRVPEKGKATFGEIILSIANQRSLFEPEQLMHNVSINLHNYFNISPKRNKFSLDSRDPNDLLEPS